MDWDEFEAGTDRREAERSREKLQKANPCGDQCRSATIQSELGRDTSSAAATAPLPVAEHSRRQTLEDTLFEHRIIQNVQNCSTEAVAEFECGRGETQPLLRTYVKCSEA